MKSKIYYIVVGLFALLALAGCQGSDGALVVATDAAFPPFEYVDEETKDIIGFDIDLMNAIAEEANLDIEFKNVAWDPLLAGMADCQYDMAISAITILPERAEQFSFSDPYINAGQIITVAVDNDTVTSPDDLVGAIIGAQLGTTGAMEVEEIPDATLKTYDTYELAFLDLMNGQVDAVIADYPTAVAFVNMNSDDLKVVGDVFTDEYYGIAFCKGNDELISQVNDALAALQAEGFIDELVNTWYGDSN